MKPATADHPNSNTTTRPHEHMSTHDTADETGETYRLEHDRISHGSVADPVTDEIHEIEAHDDERGGVLTVENPASAVYLAEDVEALGFETEAERPSEEAVRAAEREQTELADVAEAREFASSIGERVATQDLAVGEGYDPETNSPTNDPTIRATEAYKTLRSRDEDVAEYLRALPSLRRQQQFIAFLRDDAEVYGL